MENTRVVVAGAGPVGATAAYRLAHAGIDTILVEALDHCPEDMRASTLHPPTLDMLETLGVLGDLEAIGLRAPVYQYRNRKSGHIVEFDLGELADISAHPYRLQCEQFKLARLLTGLLDALPNGQARFRRRVLSYEQDGAGITIHVEAPTGIEHIRADYLIAADGANSTVRKWTRTDFRGFTYPERFLTLSTRFPLHEHIDGLANVNYVSNEQEWCVLLRVPDFWRVLVPTSIDGPETDLLSDAKKNAVFDGLVGDGVAVETAHRTLYRVHQRVAERFRHGRVLLAGDSAHLNNPLGGFGMNSGIHDVWNLTEKLIEILGSSGSVDADALLDRYHRQRSSIAHSFVQTQTMENKKAMENGKGSDAQEAHFSAIAADPTARRAYLLRQSMYDSLAQEAAIG